jgi:DNA-binding XRE family transcriptional regulator
VPPCRLRQPRFFELREGAWLTQAQLAERAGMAWRTITRLEAGVGRGISVWHNKVINRTAYGVATALAFVRSHSFRGPI